MNFLIYAEGHLNQAPTFTKIQMGIQNKKILFARINTISLYCRIGPTLGPEPPHDQG